MSAVTEGGHERLVVEQESILYLVKHAQLSIGFEVERVLAPSLPDGSGLAGISFTERALERPWFKDYDLLADGGPSVWPQRFDVSNWGLLAAYRDHQRVGGAVIAYRSPGVDMLEGREDLAVLWDLRVAPHARRQGVGSALFREAAQWARSHGCVELKVETQNVNLPACRFYARHGCKLGAINRRAYPELPDEVQLLWYLTL